MRYLTTLDALFPKTRQGLLALLLMQPERAWYAAELARQMGVPSSSLQRELRDLSEAGIITAHRRGRMAYYQANSESPVFSDLRGLLLKTAGLVDVLAKALKPLAAKIEVAFVFGSMASREEQGDSDVDLMVIGGLSPVNLSLPLRRAREAIGREINPIVYSAAEFVRKLAVKDHFLSRVMDEPKLFVIGGLHELEKIAG